jgi:hypothetical protein
MRPLKNKLYTHEIDNSNLEMNYPFYKKVSNLKGVKTVQLDDKCWNDRLVVS